MIKLLHVYLNVRYTRPKGETMNIQQLTEEQYVDLTMNILNKIDTETLDIGSMIIHKTSDGKALIQSAFDSRYILITQD